MSDLKRNPDGTVAGGSLRKKGQLDKARSVSRQVRRLMKERHGSELKVYEWLMDVASDLDAKAADRVKACQALADRMHGKPVQAVELSGPAGGPVETQSTGGTNEFTTAERLAAVARILSGTGALPLPAAAGATGGSPHPALEQVPPANR